MSASLVEACLSADLLSALDAACAVWWVAAVSVFLLKLASPAFDRLTSYGKLKAEADLADGIAARSTSFVVFYTAGLAFLAAFYAGGGGRGGLNGTLQETWAEPLPALWGRPATPAPWLFAAHLCGRLVECLVVHRFTDAERVPFFSFVSGLGFYVFAGLTVCVGDELARRGRGSSGGGVAAVIGAFAVARVVQALHHHRLAAVRVALGQPCYLSACFGRRAPREGASPRVYSLPQGLLFRWYACPHYLCEAALYMLLWTALRGGGSQATLPMAGFVALNLGVSSAKTAAWYRQRYGARLCALVPGVL